jgi:hypothetical protein
MKRFLTLAFALVAAATVGFAQTATLTLQGTVAAVATVSVATASGYNTLDIANGVTAQKVADLTERCNSRLGYTVKMTSLNAGPAGNSLYLKDTGVGTDTVPYSLTYNSASVTFASGTATLTDVAAKTPGSGVVKPLAVTIASSWVNAATYADTLTFTITAK